MRKSICMIMVMVLLFTFSGCNHPEKEDSRLEATAKLRIDDDTIEYFNSFVDNYQILDTIEEGTRVCVEAPDFGALLEQVYANAEKTISAEDWELAAEQNPNLTKVYTVTVLQVEDAAMRTAFLDAVITDLYIESVAQMDLRLLEPGERRAD